ncbi:MAG: SusF/SusE family outer membrane protein [Muribaculaceae bacterium]|nr:SusF/SusE family outer membrane protein [Muribaculaceae bacterium]
MKKIITSCLTILAALTFNANAQVWLVGDGFNGWSTTDNVEMTESEEGIYTWTGDLTAGSFFAFFKGSQNWGNQRGPASGDGSAPTGDWEDTSAGGAWKLVTSGTYEIQYNYSTDQAKIALNNEVPINPAQRRFAVTGDAFGGWNMPPEGNQVFANNGDGTYTLEFEGALAGEFKLSGISSNEVFTNDWSLFDSGTMGASNLVEGENALSSSYGTGNMTFPVSGNVILTISDVTASSCTLKIELQQVIQPDPAMYIIGSFNEWNTETQEAMTAGENNTWTITKTLEAGASFKLRNEMGTWIGAESEGTFIMTEELLGTQITMGEGNAYQDIQIPVAGEWTLAFDRENMKLVISGTWNDPTPIVGDVTGEGDVDVSDVNAVINIILNKSTQDDYPGNADVTGEGTIDVSDVNTIINIILNKI